MAEIGVSAPSSEPCGLARNLHLLYGRPVLLHFHVLMPNSGQSISAAVIIVHTDRPTHMVSVLTFVGAL